MDRPHSQGFTHFKEDPFFEGYDSKMNNLPYPPVGWFGMERPGPPAPLMREQYLVPWQTPAGDMLSPFIFPDVAGRLHAAVQQMHALANQMENSPDSHTYCSASVYRYEDDGKQEPQVYQVHHSKRAAPGGVREEKKTLRDTARKLEKYSLGRHIKERGHVLERTTHTDTNQTHQQENLHGMSKSDLERFKSDWEAALAQSMEWPAITGGQAGRSAIKGSEPKKH